MKILSNLAGSFATTDEVADVVVAYHRALEADGESELVRVPIIDDRGARLAPLAVGSLTRLTAGPTTFLVGDGYAALNSLIREWKAPRR